MRESAAVKKGRVASAAGRSIKLRAVQTAADRKSRGAEFVAVAAGGAPGEERGDAGDSQTQFGTSVP